MVEYASALYSPSTYGTLGSVTAWYGVEVDGIAARGHQNFDME